MNLKALETFATRLEELMTRTPNWVQLKLDDETHQWMAETHALLKASGEVDEAKDLREAMDTLVSVAGLRGGHKKASEVYSGRIDAMLHRALANMKAQILAMQNVDDLPMGSMG